MNTTSRWAELDADFQLTDLLGGEPFRILRRETASPWTVTAPHAVSHLDGDGASWPADRGTGGLALVLHELGLARALVAAGRWDADPDAVPSHLCPFKSMLIDEACPTLVLDLHEGRRHTGLIIDIGVRPELVRRPLHALLAAAESADFPVSVRASWPAPGLERVIDTLHDHAIPALRLAIASEYLDPWTGEPEAERLVGLLTDFLST